MRGWIHAALGALAIAVGVVSAQEIAGGPVPLQNGLAVNGSTNSASQNADFRDYLALLPAGATNLVVTMDQLTADLDLYVRFGQAPNLTTFDCRPFLPGTLTEQ
jgi:hypothetical protein